MHHKKILWLFALATLLSILPENSLAQFNPIEQQYVFRSWDNQSGLPQNTVNDIEKDHDGYLWAATEEGLIRFDGSEFHIKNESNTPGLHSSVFYDITVSPQGIWASSRNSILRINKLKTQSFDFRKNLEGSWIKCIEAEASGKLWIGTSSGELFFLVNDSFYRYVPWNPESSGSIDAIRILNDGLLLGTAKGLKKINYSRGTIYSFPELEGLQVSAIQPGNENEIWIGTADEGLFVLKNNAVSPITKKGLKEPFINSLAVAPDGAIWIGTRSNGFQVYKNGLYTSPNQKEFEHDGIKSILFRQNDVVWLGTTSSGLVNMKPSQVLMFEADKNIANSVILPIYQHPSGETWVGTAGKGLNLLQNGKTITFTTENGLSNNLVLSIYGNDKFVYIGTSNGLDRYNRKTRKIDRHFTKADGLSSNSTQSVYFDSKNRLWINTRAGGIHFMNEAGKIEKVSLSNTLNATGFLSVFEDSKGNIWFGSRGSGMVCIDPQNRIRHYNVRNGFSPDIVFDFYEDKHKVLWMATEKGLAYLHNGKFGLFDKSSGLRFNEVYRVMEDEKGYLWLSGNFGLQRVSVKNLHNTFTSNNKTVSVKLFNTVDGMANAENNGGFYPAGWKMKDGSLWFPTVQGIAIINPSIIKDAVLPLQIRLQSVKYANNEFNPNDKIVIPPDVFNIEVKYSSIDFYKAADINYYFRLKGLHKDWIAAGNRKTAYFSGLNPGNYSFEVKAEQYGQWSETSFIPITVKPHFYQTMIFKGFLVLLLMGAGFGVMLYQKSRAKRKLLDQKKITKAQINGQEKERQVIGAELHDNINQQISTAKLYLDFARSNQEMRLPMIEKSEKVLQNVINEIRSLCKSISPPTLRDMGLTEALNELFASYTDVGKFIVHFTCNAKLDELPEDLKFSVFRITQEQLNNISRHADATHVWIDFSTVGSRLFLSIKDDGKGTLVNTKPSGMGLSNIRQRLELYNGFLEVVSAPGKGYALYINIPVEHSEQNEDEVESILRPNEILQKKEKLN